MHFSDELILMNNSQQAVAVVSILDDNLLEIDETFRAEICLAHLEDRHCVVLLPSTADVTVLDNDSELPFPSHYLCYDFYIITVAIIGFFPVNYSFTEGIGLVNLTLKVTPDSGQLGREVTIGLHVLPISAICKLYVTMSCTVCISMLCFGGCLS